MNLPAIPAVARTPEAPCNSNPLKFHVEQFLREAADCQARGTVEGKQVELRRWAKWCEAVQETDLELCSKGWGAYWSFRCGQTAPRSWEKAAATHRHFWRWMRAKGLTTRDPVQIAFMPRRQSRHREAPAEEDLAKLMRGDFPETASNMGHQALLEIVLGTGCRLGEACALEQNQIDWERREAAMRIKGGGTGTMYLTERAAAALKKYQQEWRPKVALPTSPDNIVLTVYGAAWKIHRAARMVSIRCRKRGLGRITAHQLRHRFATQLLRSGAKLPEVQRLLNHRTMAATLRYLHSTAGEAKAAHAEWEKMQTMSDNFRGAPKVRRVRGKAAPNVPARPIPRTGVQNDGGEGGMRTGNRNFYEEEGGIW